MAVLLFVAQQSAAQSDEGLSPWSIFLAVAAVLGAAAAIQQLWSWWRGRRRQKALERFAEEVADQIEYGATERELSHLRRVAETIQDQIDNELPREARRVYLRNRLDTLAETIGDLFTEYEAIESELTTEGTATPLEARLRTAIEETIVPQYHLQQRRQRQLRLLLIVTLLLALLPLVIPFNNVLLVPILVYFHGMADLDLYPPSDLIGAVLTAALVVGLIVGAVLVSRVPKSALLSSSRRFVVAAISLLVAGVVSLTGALVLRNQTVQAQERYNQHSIDMYADDGGLSEAEEREDDRLQAAYDGWRRWAVLISHMSTLLIGSGLGVLALLVYRIRQGSGMGRLVQPLRRRVKL